MAETCTSPLTTSPSAGELMSAVGGSLAVPPVLHDADQPLAVTEPSVVNVMARRVEVAAGGAVVPLVLDSCAPLASRMRTKSKPDSVLKASNVKVAAPPLAGWMQ